MRETFLKFCLISHILTSLQYVKKRMQHITYFKCPDVMQYREDHHWFRSSSAKAKAFPWLLSIAQNFFFSGGSRKPPPPILSLRMVSSVNQCPMSRGSRKLGSITTPFIHSQLSSDKGAAISLTFWSTVLYLVFMLVV